MKEVVNDSVRFVSATDRKRSFSIRYEMNRILVVFCPCPFIPPGICGNISLEDSDNRKLGFLSFRYP